ncbi:MAG: chromosome segregation protein SMC, partial [Clostridia bacterium]
NQISNAKRSIKNLEDKIYMAENNLNNVVVTDEDKQKYAKLVEEIATLDDYKKRLNQEIGQLVESKDDIAKQLQSIAELKVKQQSQIEKLDGIMTSMQAHIEEEYELNYLSSLAYKIDDFNLANCAAQITKLRKAKYALGGVNVEAIEQFREQSLRFAEMSEQRDDLVNTANDCIAIIDEMSKEMKSRFETAFEIINRNFQAVFKELFGGGEGKLIIEKPEEGEDPLDAGIEIYAMPPGKSLKSITLFSGGEKALIAIAILFAILRMKAMPFCVLDEIEAALDDSNVGLFAKYLGRFSRETQFIVITHRKPTMELADRLYGVTMQEKGISKVVTVSLTEAAEAV